ncbi:MAG: phosphoadenylyl-sulfate reductase [Phycisphaerales bacterium]|nr:phosphoadenylyl-sulfate reductase [Phycisphaerales bacterium]
MELQIAPTVEAAPIGETSPPKELVAWSLEKFADRRMVITTAFGMEGCALIDMYARHDQSVSVVYLDTMFFFQETYELRDRLVERYPNLEFVNRGTTLTPEQQAKQYGDKLWERDPDLCCKLRKVDPMRPVLQEADIWITGLRKSQSKSRGQIRVVDWDWQYQVLKISPLATWDRKQVWEYVKANNVPYNALHEQSYPTVGCTHCTKPVAGASVTDYSREGRWNGKEKTECGLHGDGI